MPRTGAVRISVGGGAAARHTQLGAGARTTCKSPLDKEGAGGPEEQSLAAVQRNRAAVARRGRPKLSVQSSGWDPRGGCGASPGAARSLSRRWPIPRSSQRPRPIRRPPRRRCQGWWTWHEPCRNRAWPGRLFCLPHDPRPELPSTVHAQRQREDEALRRYIDEIKRQGGRSRQRKRRRRLVRGFRRDHAIARDHRFDVTRSRVAGVPCAPARSAGPAEKRMCQSTRRESDELA